MSDLTKLPQASSGCLPAGVTDQHGKDGFEVRFGTATAEATKTGTVTHTTNGDEVLADKSATYTKCLNQTGYGIVGPAAFALFKAALASDHAPGHIDSLVRDIQPAVKAAKGKPGDALTAAITENARQVAAQIKSKAALGDLAKEVRIVSAVYDLDTGKIEWIKD